MHFVLSPTPIESDHKPKILGNWYLYIKPNNQFSAREICVENDNISLFGDINISFLKELKEDFSRSNIEKNINKLTNGFLLVYVNKTKELTFFNDIFGYYHIFRCNTSDDLSIFSTDFASLLKYSNSQFDDYAILDLILFNYTLLDRTLLKDIKRLKGGSVIELKIDEIAIRTQNNYAENFKLGKAHKLEVKEFSRIFLSNVENEICAEYPVNVTMTGGFDSRALLASTLNLGIAFSSFTFGQKGNIEIETVNSFIDEYSQKHVFFELNDYYIKSLPKILDQFIEANLDNPTVLDLPQYALIKDEMVPSNIIAGFMGGETMQGQSIGALVTFTEFAADLLSSNSVEELVPKFDNIVGNLGFMKKEKLEFFKVDYLNTLKEYLYINDNTHLLRFMINEKYSKFFGTIGKVFKNHSNLVVPFLNYNYLNYLLHSDVSFLLKPLFKHNPINNFKSKVFYAKCIKFIYPGLGETKFDRLYRLNDLCSMVRLPRAGYGYFQSHALKRNKKQYPKPHHYDNWYGDIVIQEIVNGSENISIQFIDFKYHLDKNVYINLSSSQQKKHANLAGALLAIKKISKSN